MTPEERQALREKHHLEVSGKFHYCDWCEEKYPCDVIRVLDAWEASKATDCQHVTQPNSTVARAVSLGYQCPLCGWHEPNTTNDVAN